MKLQFNKYYFTVAAILFIAEIGIAQTTGFIRYTFGDYLVVILLYTLLKSFTNLSTYIACVTILCTAFCIEFLQLTNLLQLLNLQNNTTAKLILGTSFSIGDLIAYTLGIFTVYFFEKRRTKIKF